MSGHFHHRSSRLFATCMVALALAAPGGCGGPVVATRVLAPRGEPTVGHRYIPDGLGAAVALAELPGGDLLATDGQSVACLALPDGGVRWRRDVPQAVGAADSLLAPTQPPSPSSVALLRGDEGFATLRLSDGEIFDEGTVQREAEVGLSADGGRVFVLRPSAGDSPLELVVQDTGGTTAELRLRFDDLVRDAAGLPGWLVFRQTGELRRFRPASCRVEDPLPLPADFPNLSGPGAATARWLPGGRLLQLQSSGGAAAPADRFFRTTAAGGLEEATLVAPADTQVPVMLGPVTPFPTPALPGRALALGFAARELRPHLYVLDAVGERIAPLTPLREPCDTAYPGRPGPYCLAISPEETAGLRLRTVALPEAPRSEPLPAASVPLVAGPLAVLVPSEGPLVLLDMRTGARHELGDLSEVELRALYRRPDALYIVGVASSRSGAGPPLSEGALRRLADRSAIAVWAGLVRGEAWPAEGASDASLASACALAGSDAFAARQLGPALAALEEAEQKAGRTVYVVVARVDTARGETAWVRWLWPMPRPAPCDTNVGFRFASGPGGAQRIVVAQPTTSGKTTERRIALLNADDGRLLAVVAPPKAESDDEGSDEKRDTRLPSLLSRDERRLFVHGRGGLTVVELP